MHWSYLIILIIRKAYITDWLTDWVTTWNEEMLAHLKIFSKQAQLDRPFQISSKEQMRKGRLCWAKSGSFVKCQQHCLHWYCYIISAQKQQPSAAVILKLCTSCEVGHAHKKVHFWQKLTFKTNPKKIWYYKLIMVSGLQKSLWLFNRRDEYPKIE